MSDLRLTRRHFLAGTAAASTLGFPGIVRSQPKEIVIGGAASHKAFMEPTVIPMFEKKYACKIIFEGTKSLVNLEKMVSNKAKPYLSVVMMDDPVLLLAVKEDVIEKITPAQVANLAKLKPAAIHMDYQADAAFKKLRALKPNLLTVYTQMPQAFNLLEQGEAWLIGGALSSYAAERKRQGAAVDMGSPREGVMAMPSGIARVKNGPQPELALAFINEMLGVEYQKILSEAAAALPTNTAVAVPAGLPKDVFVPDWAYVSDQRKAWVERWDKDMSV